MPTPTSEIIAEADQLLQPSLFDDYGPNGLQVPGPDEVSTLVTGVSAHLELFQRAAAAHADLLLVHHGLFWGSSSEPLDPIMKGRLQALFDADIALAAYHLPLDAHPTLGNNASIATGLGCTELQPFALHRGQPIGFTATLPGPGLPISSSQGGGPPAPAGSGERPPVPDAPGEGLLERVTALIGHRPLFFDHGPPTIRKVAIVSGAGSDYLAEAAQAGADVLITGEPAERAMALSRELSIHFIAAGHHCTETFGVRRLGEHLAEHFGLTHLFIDIPNPI